MNDSKVSLRNNIKLAPWLRTTIRRCWYVVSVFVMIGALVAANGGMFDPRSTSFPAILSMSFPMWMVALTIVALITVWVNRRMALVLWVGALFCTGGLSAWMPLNFFHSEKIAPADSAYVVKIMTYNTFGFNDDENIYPDKTNRTASTIISSGADIVFLQEIGLITDIPVRCFTQAQVDSLNVIYPYSMFNEKKMTGILSRWPLKWVDLPQPDDCFAGWEGATATINGVDMLLVSVHLQSLGLNSEDKIVYHDMTSGEDVDWRHAGKIIYDKIAGAMKARAGQAHMLRNALDTISIGGVLIAGDFNDINNCYAMRTICGDDLRSTFTAVGHGTTITYHRDRFLFNIDHILYGGDVTPVNIHTGTSPSSDHYPVYATFLIGKQ